MARGGALLDGSVLDGVLAFGLGYVISCLIQVVVTETRIKRSMGESGRRSVALATVFGFVSSSCSFAALATSRSLFAKGAGLVSSLAFLITSTNPVIELGIINRIVGAAVRGMKVLVGTVRVIEAVRPLGEVLERFVTKRRDKRAALKFLKKAMNNTAEPGLL